MSEAGAAQGSVSSGWSGLEAQLRVTRSAEEGAAWEQEGA